jgi:hypothetical protein
MITLRPSTEEEMILAFVKGEVESTNEGEKCRRWLWDHGHDRATVIDNGIPTDLDQNRIRAELLKTFRGYPDTFLFTGYPRDVEWRRVQADLGELANFRYANVPALTEVSGGTRRVSDGAKNVESGTALEEFSERVKGTVVRIRNNERLPDLIAIEADDKQIILVDGHGRATAYVLMGMPDVIEVLIGSSPHMGGWYWI